MSTLTFHTVSLALGDHAFDLERGQEIEIGYMLSREPLRIDFVVVSPWAAALELVSASRDLSRIPREHWLSNQEPFVMDRAGSARWAPRDSLTLQTAERVAFRFRNPTPQAILNFRVSSLATTVVESASHVRATS